MSADEPYDSPWLTQAEAAELLDVHRTTVSNMIRDGQLPTTRIGRRNRIHRDDVLALISRRPVA